MRVFILALIAVLFATGCPDEPIKTGCADDSACAPGTCVDGTCVQPPAAQGPTIESFLVSPNILSAGESTTLVARFRNGVGVVDQGVGVVESGAFITVSPAANITYTLTVTHPEHAPVSATASVAVHPLPVIVDFSATPAVTPGAEATLLPTFTGGTGTIDPGIGAVESGQEVRVPVSAPTTFTLTVVNPLDVMVTAQATVNLRPKDFPCPPGQYFFAPGTGRPNGGLQVCMRPTASAYPTRAPGLSDPAEDHQLFGQIPSAPYSRNTLSAFDSVTGNTYAVK